MRTRALLFTLLAAGCGDAPAGDTTADGALALTAMPAPTTETLRGVWAGPATAWAAGDAGIVLRFDGATWRRVETPTGEDLLAIWGSGVQRVWAVGRRGTILSFDGARFVAEDSGVDVDLTGVCGSSEAEVWAVAADGSVLRRGEGGWARHLDAGPALAATWTDRADVAWAVGAAVQRFDGAAWRPIAADDGAFLDVHGRGEVVRVLGRRGAGSVVLGGGASGLETIASFDAALHGLALRADGDVVAVGRVVVQVTPEATAEIDVDGAEGRALLDVTESPGGRLFAVGEGGLVVSDR